MQIAGIGIRTTVHGTPTPVMSWTAISGSRLMPKLARAATDEEIANTSGGTKTLVRIDALLTIDDPVAIKPCEKKVRKTIPDNK
jgi:hypothetical protein